MVSSPSVALLVDPEPTAPTPAGYKEGAKCYNGVGSRRPPMPSAPRDSLACARFIREMMTNRGISQSELARRLDMASQGFVSLVLSGERQIPHDDTRRWMAALELNAEQQALFKRYAIRSYGTPCANEFVDALDDANARLDSLSREVATTAQAFEAMKKYAEALERELASHREAAATDRGSSENDASNAG